jgi:hypothetical protein
MPGFWAAVRRWGAAAGSVVLPMVTAAAVVAGSLSIAVTPGDGRTKLTSAVLWAPSLADVRPDDSGTVDPRLAAAVDAILARRGRAVRINDVSLFLRDVSPGLQGWIVVRPDARRELDGPRLAHAQMYLAPVRLGDQAPRWLAEGLAEYAENQQLTLSGRGGEVVHKRARVGRKALSGLAALPADDMFDDTGSADISWLAVDLLIREVGRTGVTDFYRQVASRGYNSEIRERLLLEYTGLTEQELARSLRNQVG